MIKRKPFKHHIDIKESDRLWQRMRSASGQDLFVIAMTQGKNDGFFLEFGACFPNLGNNTFLLEKLLNWSGISIDLKDWTLDWNISDQDQWFKKCWHDYYQSLKAPLWPDFPDSIDNLSSKIQEELRQWHDYDFWHQCFYNTNGTWKDLRPKTRFLKQDANSFDFSQLPSRIDYLQIDVDCDQLSQKLLENTVKVARCSVITYEHDVFVNSPGNIRSQQYSRDLLTKLGYVMIANDVMVDFANPYPYEDWWVDPLVIDKSVIQSYQCIGNDKPKHYTEILYAPQQE